jgi:hypothetical protein
MRKCLECGAELTSKEAIIYHTCEAYPEQVAKSWFDLMLDINEKGKGNE